MIKNEMPLKFWIFDFMGKYWLLGLVILAKIVMQYGVVNPLYELHRDEFLHLNQANHLAFGFISVPPLTSLFSLIIYGLGGSIFWIRFFPAIFGAMTIVIAWLIVEQLEGKVYAKILVSAALLFSVYVRINILFQPNSFDILAWTLVYYFLIRYLKTENKKWIFWMVLAAILGFYNKYNIAFLIIGLGISLVITVHRKVFLQPVFWKYVACGIILLLPNILWQITHHFPFFRHMQALQHYQLTNNTSTGFLMSQLIIISGSLPVIFAAILGFMLYKPFQPYRVLVLSLGVILLIFTWLKAKDYYALGLYPVFIAAGAVYLESILREGWLRYLRPVPVLLNLILFIGVARFLFPVLSPEKIVQNHKYFESIGLLRWEDGKNHAIPQDFSDMLGWKEMSERAWQVYKRIPEDQKKKTLIFCDNYGECGALNYYNRYKTPEAYAFNTDYIYWIPRMAYIQNVILVGEKPDKNILAWFSGYTCMGQVKSVYSREKGTPVYLLQGSKKGFTEMFYQMAEDRKRKFDIF